MVLREINIRGKCRVIRFPVKDYSIFLSESREHFRRRTLLLRFKIIKDLRGKINPVDFKFIKPIGMGTFGLVYLSMLKITGTYYAIKVLRKQTILNSNAGIFISRYRKYIEGINFPFCLGIHCTFQDTGFLFLCQPLMTGGDLFWHLSKEKRFFEPLVVFYAAQLVLAIEYLHFIGIVHRNIKPENIVMDKRGYIKLTGFTFAKKIRNWLTYTMCGTPEYMAPEMILQIGHSRSVDWWSLGILIYELITGFTPFHADDILTTYKKALRARYRFGATFSVGLQELLPGLIKIEPLERLGMRRGGVQEIKDARWFRDIDWLALINQQLIAPFVPPNDPIDSNFPVLESVQVVPPTEKVGDFRSF